MANYRQVHTKIWKDPWFIDLEPEEKFLFVYLFTNELASICGLFELPERVIQFETGLERGQIKKALNKFAKNDKVHYENGVIWVVNLRKYHETKSPKVQTRIQKDIDAVPDCAVKEQYLIRYGYRMDTVSDTVSIPPSSLVTSKSSVVNSSNTKSHPVWKMPEALKTEQFETAWIAWYRHKLEMDTPLTQTAGEFQLQELAELGERRAIAAIRHSISKGWKSIYEDKGGASGGSSGTVTHAEGGGMYV